MSAGVKFRDDLVWLSNATVECYLEDLIEMCEKVGDGNVQLLNWLKEWREKFFPGAIVDLSEILSNDEGRRRFAAMLQELNERYANGDEFTELGKEMIRERMMPFTERLCGNFEQ